MKSEKRKKDELYFKIWWIMNEQKIENFKFFVQVIFWNLVVVFFYFMAQKHFGKDIPYIVLKLCAGLGIFLVAYGKFSEYRNRLK